MHISPNLDEVRKPPNLPLKVSPKPDLRSLPYFHIIFSHISTTHPPNFIHILRAVFPKSPNEYFCQNLQPITALHFAPPRDISARQRLFFVARLWVLPNMGLFFDTTKFLHLSKALNCASLGKLSEWKYAKDWWWCRRLRFSYFLVVSLRAGICGRSG